MLAVLYLPHHFAYLCPDLLCNILSLKGDSFLFNFQGSKSPHINGAYHEMGTTEAHILNTLGSLSGWQTWILGGPAVSDCWWILLK